MQRVVLDTDLAMGAVGSDIDDGFALALALADPGIALDLVTTVNGNTDVETATSLTLELLHRLDRAQVPVHRGATRPLLRPQARSGHLPDGVPVRQPRPGHAALAMVEHVREHPGEVTVVAIGPLTNIALAVRLDPDFAPSLKRLVVMGGVFLGHTHDATMPGEFNLWSDPEAAAIVLDSGVVADFVGLDVTTQVRLDRRQARQMADSGGSFASFAGRCTTAWIEHLASTSTGSVHSCALHDPLAVAAVTQDLLTWREAHVQVELGDRLRGAVLADFQDRESSTEDAGRGGCGSRANARVAVAVDAQAFTTFFTDKVQQL
ncbi:nucleoside hydrolase [Kineococcus indalonis]|uniref:nucleoside hydrolase n=1 Tax=Kineococcus indalonis TaxID=2696566 RepID=UPI001412E37B|nr:nucleoside hydrolase [Kineococcus indalonis]NAZ84659.1 hypothetical protein [Kineococcus indalonis]